MRGMLIDQHEAIRRLRHNIGCGDLAAGHTQRRIGQNGTVRHFCPR